jgi:hypothetical protein
MLDAENGDTPMKNKCGHELCDCEIGTDATYCSVSCEQQAKAEPGDRMECDCGHLGCGAGMTNEPESVEYA